MTSTLFAITLNKTKNPKRSTAKKLVSLLYGLCRTVKAKVCCYTIEVGITNGITHLHGTISCNVKPTFIRRGHQIIVKEIYDHPGWINYIHKQQ